MIEILDTTLRDGEQTAGVSFNSEEKLAIARLLLDELGVNRIEAASARVSEGENKAFSKICRWASETGHLHQVEALGFIDGHVSVDWIWQAGGRVVNLLSKGSLRHLEKQLHQTPRQHIQAIEEVVAYAVGRDMQVNLYLEDWSNGIQQSPDYVFELVGGLQDAPISRFMLPDTLGILNYSQTRTFITLMREHFPKLHFDFHGHNDYDLAVANTFAAVEAGARGIHATVNGLGERTGNTPLASIVAILNDQLHMENTIRESKITHVCRYVENISGIRIPSNKPIVGESVFTQSSGVHADGDCKDRLYMSNLTPERFGRERHYALGKTSGKANIVENLKLLGITLTPEQIRLVTQRVVELGDKKETINTEDLPFIIADVLKSGENPNDDNIHIINYSLQLARGMHPVAIIRISIHGIEYEETSIGDGQFDSFMKALWKIYDRLGKSHPILADYQVTIPPGGKSDALVQTLITWAEGNHRFKTRGIDSDQTEAAIKATVKMLNIIENNPLG